VLPKHGGDRNRTSPFAFTGNKFEFRALGSSQSISLTNTVLNTIVAQAIDVLTAKLEPMLDAGTSLNEAVLSVVKDAYIEHQRIVFDGDGYSEEWTAEAEKRGLLNLRTTPEALPWLTNPQTVELFEAYNVLSHRELEAREEILFEQYVIKLNIEGETTAQIARTQILPAAVRHLAELKAAGAPEGLISETSELLQELFFSIEKLEAANEIHEDDTIVQEAKYMLESVIPAMASVREVGDKLEKIVADDLWPLPKYWEMLFIK
jgi:glutamine synthetase